MPISKGGAHTPTVLLHKICHNKIHSVITEAELLRYYNTIPRLKQHPEIDKFITWIANKPPDFYDGSAYTAVMKTKKAKYRRK